MKKVLVFILLNICITSKAVIIGMLMDSLNDPVHIFAKKTENNDVIVTVVKKNEFIECVIVPGFTFGRDLIYDYEDGTRILSISLYQYDRNGKPFDGQSESQAFLYQELGKYRQEISMRDEFYNNNTSFYKEDELKILAGNKNILCIFIQSFKPGDRDSKPEMIAIKLEDLKESYSNIYKSHFEKALSL